MALDIFDFNRLIAPIKNKIFLLIGRCILKAVTDTGTGTTQVIQVTGLKDEILSDVERMQEYGLDSIPPAESEAIILFPNGNRDQGICIKVHDRVSRPTPLLEGDVILYNKAGFQIILDSTGITLNSGDAATWAPNTLTTDPFTGLPHSVGITKLKGL